MALLSTSVDVEVNLEIKASDMEQDWIVRGEDFIKSGLVHCRSEKALAAAIKAGFDKAFGYGWNVIVGKRYGSHVFHKTKMYLYVCIRDLYILIWQS
jgi:dynein light chain LC8-type